jgi:hypothetical protein
MACLKFNKQKQEWEDAQPGTEGSIYLDGFLRKRLDRIQVIKKKKWDCVFLIDGKERAGKSTMGFLCGTYLDPNLGLGQVAANADEALSKLESLPDGSVMIIDEGSLMFSSKDVMKQEQKQLIKILNVIGQKSMVLIIILPCFFDLTKYIAVNRSRFLLHVYTSKQLDRGRFAYWGENKKAKLYIYGKKNYNSYAYPRADFIGRFAAFDPFGEEYQKLKRKSLFATFHDGDDIKQKDSRYRKLLLRLFNYLYFEKRVSQFEIRKILHSGISVKELREMLEEIKKDGIRLRAITSKHNPFMQDAIIEKPVEQAAEVPNE